MTFVITDPDMLAAAADELQGIGSALEATNTAAAAPTTGVLPPAADSVSARTAALLDAHAQQYQAFAAQAESFQNQFVQTLIAAQNSYAETETANTATMQLTSATSTPTTTSPTNVALIMGATGNPTPSSAYMMSIEEAYLAQNYPGYTLVSLQTPEQLFPTTGLASESLNKSIQQGLAILNNAIMTQTEAGNHVVVVGYSQSATIASLEMRYLDALPAGIRPSPNLLNFVLLGDPNNPMSGLLTRFAGLDIPVLNNIPGVNALFNAVTPANTIYHTAIYTLQYDGIADFPRYPIDLLADLNAIFGALSLHSTYPNLTAAQLANALLLPVSPGYAGVTSYYLIPATNLPLLDPLIDLGMPAPIIDLIQPTLQLLVNLGYGTGSANIAAPAGLFPPINLLTLFAELLQAGGQGVEDALAATL